MFCTWELFHVDRLYRYIRMSNGEIESELENLSQ